ncbi:MAG: 2,3-bisphosphoglycerate-independent phosphoglycerate mutase [Actinomycetia bacterium]|nr:2,3-bisphosphoglycerate-independent phosphoglycerate mutase [Actinomycetes bacterium]
MQYAIVILDGAADEPQPSLANQTILAAAVTPWLDSLAAQGEVGLAALVPASLEPSSNVACTAILGYDPVDYPIGRGALELSALGIELADNEIALRTNLCHVSDQGVMVSYSCDNISSVDGHALCQELQAVLDDEQCRLYAGGGFRLYLVVKNRPGLLQTELAAAHNITDQPLADFPPRGPEAAWINDYLRRAAQVLASSPTNARRAAAGQLVANRLMCFWPGQRPSGMPAFQERYGRTAALNTGVDLLAGLAALTGIELYRFTGVTDGPDNDYAAQGLGVLEMLRQHDVVFVHVEAPDTAGHDGDVLAKKQAVEAIDREIISRLVNYSQNQPLRILALPDHPTPVLRKRHAPGPVPFVLAGPGVSTNGGRRLTEQEAARCGLRVDPGWQLLSRLLAETT